MNATAKDLIEYRFARAQEALEEAHMLADGQHWNACVNRLYYACFYAVSSLLAKYDLTASKHSGVRSLFNANFVKTGMVTKKLLTFTMTFLSAGRKEITRIFLFLRNRM